jgi:NAD(P)-dependent dehydrogenase (short-subunit alcohol dehydrogenase family)
VSSSNRVAIVTGAASGIGRAAASELVARGLDVVVADLDGDGASRAAAELDEVGTAHAVQVDMADSAQVERLVAETAERFGRLDVVVNNAGVQRSGAVTDFAESDWDLLLGVNPKSCFLAAKHAVPLMRSTAGGGGSIVNVSSIAGLKGGPGQTAYSASKGAIVAFSRALAVELAADSIRVNCLCPGWVDTPFNAPAIEFMGGRDQQDAMIAATVPLGRQGRPDEIARTIAFLALDDSAYMTGQALVVDGGQI